MAIALMIDAFKASCSPTQKLVLLALCDSANDHGVCWPSVATLLAKCSLGERTIRRALGELEEIGGLVRDEREGRSTVYRVTPAALAPLPDMHPCQSGRGGVPEWQGGGAALAGGGCQSGTHNRNRTQKEPKEKPKEAALPPWVDAQAWADFEAMRKANRKPMTPAAKRLAVAELAKLRDSGQDPTEVMRQSTLRSWAGLFPVKEYGQHARRPGPEPEWAREKRERIAAFAGPAAARPRTQIIEMEDIGNGNAIGFG